MKQFFLLIRWTSIRPAWTGSSGLTSVSPRCRHFSIELPQTLTNMDIKLLRQVSMQGCIDEANHQTWTDIGCNSAGL